MIKITLKEKNNKKIAQKYSIELLLLFDSQIRERKYLHKESDFDIGYLSKRILSIEEKGRLMLDLAPFLKIPLQKNRAGFAKGTGFHLPLPFKIEEANGNQREDNLPKRTRNRFS